MISYITMIIKSQKFTYVYYISHLSAILQTQHLYCIHTVINYLNDFTQVLFNSLLIKSNKNNFYCNTMALKKVRNVQVTHADTSVVS